MMRGRKRGFSTFVKYTFQAAPLSTAIFGIPKFSAPLIRLSVARKSGKFAVYLFVF